MASVVRGERRMRGRSLPSAMGALHRRPYRAVAEGCPACRRVALDSGLHAGLGRRWTSCEDPVSTLDGS